jgi:hypothetical protein
VVGATGRPYDSPSPPACGLGESQGLVSVEGELLRRLSKLLGGVVAAPVVGFVLATGVPVAAIADPPPPGYPTEQIMASASNPVLGDIFLRRGFWDANAGQGWGFDKAWHYHNIKTLLGQTKVMMSTNRVLQGNGNWQLRAYAQKVQCPNGHCTVVEEIQVLGIHNPGNFSTYFGWPVNGVLGLQTMYCNQGGVVTCPSWVTIALQNIPVAGSQFDGDVEPRRWPGIEAGLPEELLADQQLMLDTPELVELRGAVEAGETILTGSFVPKGPGN